MQNDIELFPMQRKDCEAVYEIAKESLPEHWSLQGVCDVLRYDSSIYYVAYCKDCDEIVGFAGVMLVAEEAELLNIAVKPSYQNQGVGQLLLAKVMKQSAEQGAERILLEVRKSNVQALHLYKENFFSELGIRKAYYNNPTEDAIIMERIIGNGNVLE